MHIYCTMDYGEEKKIARITCRIIFVVLAVLV